MKKLMFLTMIFGLMIAFTAGVSAQNVGRGEVLSVYNASELTPKSGDDVITRIKTSNGDYGMKKGSTYYSLELRQGNKAMYISYPTNSEFSISEFKDKINNKNVTVTRARSLENWKTEDDIQFATRRISGGGT